MKRDQTPGADYALLLKAIHFAAEMHRNHRRKDPNATPYINHPIFVAWIIAEIGGIRDLHVLIAALLHDAIEDTGTTATEIGEMFGERIKSLVLELTDDKALPRELRKRLQTERASQLSPAAVLITLGDKISNVSEVTSSSPADWDERRKIEYLDWAESVICNCRKTNQQLEEHFQNALAEARCRLRSPREERE